MFIMLRGGNIKNWMSHIFLIYSVGFSLLPYYPSALIHEEAGYLQ